MKNIFQKFVAILAILTLTVSGIVAFPSETDAATYDFRALVLAGGGGGGSPNTGNTASGGGGAGGYQESSSLALTENTLYTITVGAGGAGGDSSSLNQGRNGSDSSIGSTLVSIGGGGGGSTDTGGSNGGSGGGAAGDVNSSGGTATAGQGNDGGDNTSNGDGGAGGGGNTAGGSNSSTDSGGNGGGGTASDITGSSVTRGGGGGGGDDDDGGGGVGGSATGGGGAGGGSGANGSNATANTGGGGGGAGDGLSTTGGNGGSGVVIIRYPTSNITVTDKTGATETTSGGDTILTWNTSGSFKFTYPTSRTINAANYTYCRTITSNNNGYTNGIATTTTGLFPLFASSTISTLAATSSGGNVQLIGTTTSGTFTDEPIDIVFTDESTCSFNTSISAIPHYFEKYASTTGAFSVHLGTSNISSTTAKTVAMYYGNANATNLNSPGQVYATSSPTGIASHWDLSVPGYATTTYPDFAASVYNDNYGSSKLMNKADLVSGQVGGGLDFDQVNDQIQISDNDSINPTASIAISFWFKRNGVGAIMGLIHKGDGATNASSAYEFVFSAADLLRFEVSSNAWSTAESATAISDTTNWHHAVGTYDGSNVKIYIDGVLKKSTAASITINNDSNILSIGRLSAGAASRPYGGVLDDLRFYRSSISSADVQTIYNNTANSAAFWTFGSEQTQGSTLTQRNYGWAVDDGNLTTGGLKAAKNNSTTIFNTGVLRLRIDVAVSSANLSAGAKTFTLQYKTLGAGCGAAESWTTLGAVDSGVIWRGYNNASLVDGTTLTNVLLDPSNIFESYEEDGSSVANPTAVSNGSAGEWDWVVQNNGAVIGETYCFKMVETTGLTDFSAYTNYPQITVALGTGSGGGGGSGGTAPEAGATGGGTDQGGGSGQGDPPPPGSTGGGTGEGGGAGGGIDAEPRLFKKFAMNLGNLVMAIFWFK